LESRPSNTKASRANEFQCGEYVILALAGHAHALGPPAGHVGRDQREQVLAAIADATVGDQIDLEEADALFVPRRPGADRLAATGSRACVGSP
jgi:hypothetical protein